jgi:O-methyltransferase involved in polyketide biosynthesis
MEEERPSSTAEGAAIMRALHQTLDDEPKIVLDPIVSSLIDAGQYEATWEHSSRYRLRSRHGFERCSRDKVDTRKTAWQSRSTMACANI